MLQYAKPVKYQATVAHKKQLTSKVFLTIYQLTNPSAMSFYPGQTISLTVAPGTFRPMSIASPPQERSRITTFQDISPGGPGSQWMLRIREGDTLEFMGPLGRFTADYQSPRKKVLIATGTGIAPYWSMLYDTTETKISDENIALYWGLRYKEDMYLTDEIAQLKQERKNLAYYFVLSKPPDDWQGLRGHINEYVFANEKTLTNCDFYLCGNNAMIRDMESALLVKGVPKEQIKKDVFF